MTKQGNFTQRTPQAKKQSDQASKQVSKQASGSTNAPHDLVFPATGPSLGTTQPTATITSTEDLRRVAFTTPPQTALGTNSTEPPPPPIRNKGPRTLVALMQEETKKRSSQNLQARLNFGPEDEVSPPRHRKERRREDNRRPPVFGRIGKQVSGTQTANLQNLSAHENNDWRISVHDRLGNRDVHSRLGQRALTRVKVLQVRRTPEDTVAQAPRRVSVSGPQKHLGQRGPHKRDHWKSRTDTVRQDSLFQGSPKGRPFARRIYANGVTSVYMERYKDECIHVKACPEILKISGFMNGINNPELIKRLNDRVPQTFDELMKRTRSFIQGEAAAADSRKGYSNNRSQEHSRRQSNDQSSSRNNNYRSQRGGRGNDKYTTSKVDMVTPLTMKPQRRYSQQKAQTSQKHHPKAHSAEEQRAGEWILRDHRLRVIQPIECVHWRQLIDKLVKEGRLDHLDEEHQEGKSKQRGEAKKTT
ncbi:hypothetical protein Tco_1106541 [Tanacetum coccineum]